MKNYIFTAILSAYACAAIASTESPYAGQETRGIKSLSQKEARAYLNGDGLGFAKSAELNHFPGPRHVLDLAEELGLTEQQIQKSQALFDVMKIEAAALGKQYVTKEQELEQQFSSNSIDSVYLEDLLSEIGTLQTKIRYVHLNAHIKQKALLTQHQVHSYDQLRGYGGTQNSEHHHSH